MSFAARFMDGWPSTSLVITAGVNGANTGYAAGTANWGTLTTQSPKSKITTNGTGYLSSTGSGTGFTLAIGTANLGATFFRQIIGVSGVSGTLLASAATYSFGAFNGVNQSQWSWTTTTFNTMTNGNTYSFLLVY